MKVHIRYGYRGQLTGEQYLPAGDHDLDDALAAYLIENDHADAVEENPPVQTFSGVFGGLKPITTVDTISDFNVEQASYVTIVTAPGGPVTVPSDDLGTDGDRDHEDTDVDLSTMTKTQLIEYAAARGLTLSDRLTKQAMIDEIEAL